MMLERMKATMEGGTKKIGQGRYQPFKLILIESLEGIPISIVIRKDTITFCNKREKYKR